MQRFYGSSVEPLGDREVGVIASTSQLASDGHIIEPAGIDISGYLRNPIVLWQHQPTEPVGVATAVGVRDGALMARIRFAPEGASPTADQIYSLTRAGIVQGCSIGFDPRESSPLDPKNPRAGQRFTRIELLEISFVSVPSDTGAGVIERSFRGGAAFRSLTDVPASAVQRVDATLPRRRAPTPFSPTIHAWMLVEQRRLDDEARYSPEARRAELERLAKIGRGHRN